MTRMTREKGKPRSPVPMTGACATAMNIVLVSLKEKLDSLLHQEAEITNKQPGTLLIYKNPYGGKPLQVLFNPEEDIKVTRARRSLPEAARWSSRWWLRRQSC